MHDDPITALQLAQQRHRADLRSAELRRSVRSADQPRRRWFAGSAGRTRAAQPVAAGPIADLGHAC